MRAAGWLWHELTRPRGPLRTRFYRPRRRSRSGIALLVVIASILLMTVLVTEISYSATVRLQLGAHHRDEAKAEALAYSGVHVYRLLLVAAKGIGSNPMARQLGEQFGIEIGDQLWQEVPFISSGLLRLLFSSGGRVDTDDLVAFRAEGLTDEQVEASRGGRFSDRHFLDFDGDFYAEVSDEDRRINVSNIEATNLAELMDNATAAAMHAMMSGRRTCPDPFVPEERLEADDLDQFFYERNLERWELIGNLVDWTSPSNTRVYQGGPVDVLYNRLESPYLPKNAPFDTLQEVRLVDGWHLDDVWEKFGDQITVYGSGRINVNTAECPVLWALVKSYVEPRPSDDEAFMYVQAIETYRAAVPFGNANAFTGAIQAVAPPNTTVRPQIRQVITTRSNVFRVVSLGQVNDATVSIEAVIDFTRSPLGQVVYWRVQ